MMSESTDRVALLMPFHPDTYTYNKQGLVVVGGPVIEHRLDSVTGGMWETANLVVEYRPEAKTKSGTEYVPVVVTLDLIIPGYPPTHGCGSHCWFPGGEVGNSVKAATTLAIRNAGNRRGLARELWPSIAGPVWCERLAMMSTREQVAEAYRILKAVHRWLDNPKSDSDNAPKIRDHQIAWRKWAPMVDAAMSEAIDRVKAGKIEVADEEILSVINDEPDDSDDSDDRDDHSGANGRSHGDRYEDDRPRPRRKTSAAPSANGAKTTADPRTLRQAIYALFEPGTAKLLAGRRPLPDAEQLERGVMLSLMSQAVIEVARKLRLPLESDLLESFVADAGSVGEVVSAVREITGWTGQIVKLQGNSAAELETLHEHLATG